MREFLLEILSEDIPARMQVQAADDLKRLVTDALTAAGLTFTSAVAHSTPRRLVLVIEGLPETSPDRTEERKGPRVGAPNAAIEGFLRSTGLTRDQLTERDGVWFAVIARNGRPTADIIAEMVEQIVRAFPWPKSMKWGTGSLRWASSRPTDRGGRIMKPP